MTMTMDDIDALQLDFLKSYDDDDEGEGLLPKFGGGVKAAPVVPEPVKSSKPEGTPVSAKNARRKRRSPKVPWKKPKDMPRRPLSAYNLFFQKERERLVKIAKCEKSASDDAPEAVPIADPVISSDANMKTSSEEQVKDTKKGKGRPHIKSTGIGFANLAKTIAAKWKQIDPEARVEFEKLAAAEKERYNKEMAVWRGKKKVEKQLNEKVHSLDTELMFASGASSLPHTRPTFMRRLSDPYPDTQHYLELYRHRQQYMFNSSFTRACLAQMMQGSSSLEPFMEPSLEPLMEPLSVPSLNSIDCELENTFQEEPTDALRAFSDSFLDNHIHDVRPCEDFAYEPMMGEQKKLPGLRPPTSLKALGSTLDDDTVDFMTHINFEH